jgi:hypothetical protein
MIKAGGKRRQRAVPDLGVREITVTMLAIRSRRVKVTATSSIKDKGKRIKDETGKQSICIPRI